MDEIYDDPWQDEDYPHIGLFQVSSKTWDNYNGYADTTGYIFDAKQYKEWMDKTQEDALKKYFKKVLKVIDDLQENIDDVKTIYGDESYVDNIIRDLKAKAYDDLEELLVTLAF